MITPHHISWTLHKSTFTFLYNFELNEVMLPIIVWNEFDVWFRYFFQWIASRKCHNNVQFFAQHFDNCFGTLFTLRKWTDLSNLSFACEWKLCRNYILKKTPTNWSSNENHLSSKSNGFENIGSTTHTAIEKYFDSVAHRFYDLRKCF